MSSTTEHPSLVPGGRAGKFLRSQPCRTRSCGRRIRKEFQRYRHSLHSFVICDRRILFPFFLHPYLTLPLPCLTAFHTSKSPQTPIMSVARWPSPPFLPSPPTPSTSPSPLPSPPPPPLCRPLRLANDDGDGQSSLRQSRARRRRLGGAGAGGSIEASPAPRCEWTCIIAAVMLYMCVCDPICGISSAFGRDREARANPFKFNILLIVIS